MASGKSLPFFHRTKLAVALAALATCGVLDSGCVQRKFSEAQTASQPRSLDSVRRIVSTGGSVTPLFTWFSSEGRGAELIANPSQSLEAKLNSAWERVRRGKTAAYDAQGGAGTYFAEDPFTSYEFGDTLLIAFTPPQERKLIDYFGPGVDDPETGAPAILDKAIQEDFPAFRYSFGGWFGGKALVVRHPSFLDLRPDRLLVMKRPAPMRSFDELDAAQLRGLVGRPWVEVLPQVIDQAERFEQMHRWLFPETDTHTNKTDVTVLTPEGKLTDDGVVWYVRQALAHPSTALKDRFRSQVDKLGTCGQWAMPQCTMAFDTFLKSGRSTHIPPAEFGAMLQLLEFLPGTDKPQTPDEFKAALASFNGPKVRPVVEALTAIVLNLHAQLGQNPLSRW